MKVEDLATAIRILSIDAVEQAQSGHPGMPLGMADIATVLWHQFLRHNPTNPYWFNRDRFVLSNGHGSMLLYSLLHLTGYALPIEEIKHFRQLHSKTPGHPEWGETPGVETTTGPLGQGLANAVGMAIAEKNLAAQFNKPDLSLVDHYTYVFVGDGCLMEGISHEVCSLAGTLELGKLIVFYDDNGISIDGAVKGWFTDNTSMRFEAYHWQVIGPIDGHNPEAIQQAIIQAKEEKLRPTLIICKTIIGYLSHAANSEKAHGAPLGAPGVAEVRKNCSWNHDPFHISEILYQHWNHKELGLEEENTWLGLCEKYKKAYPQEYFEFLRRINGDLPENWSEITYDLLAYCRQENGPLATRRASQMCLEFLSPYLPELLGGSADLTGSNNTNWSKSQALTVQDFSGNYLYYGVREFGMAAMMNGLALHGGIIPYGGTFLVFTDYARNAIRLSALMRQRVIYILTHDSIGLGEDGPTHQPIEHASMLRMTPNIEVWRPANLLETAIAWIESLNRIRGPSALLLSRQNLPILENNALEESIKKGGYILYENQNIPDCILIATGSEVSIALNAAKIVAEQGIGIRVVSMPCAERFLAQDESYRDTILPPQVRKRIAIEAAATAFWYRFVGLDGVVVGLDRFGVSAPAPDAYQYLNITVERVIEEINTISANRLYELEK